MENVYRSLSPETPRIPKNETLKIEEWHKTATLSQKIDRAHWLIETAIRHVSGIYGNATKVVVSCSFGVDSVVTLHLVKTVCDRMGVQFDVVWNNTLNEFPQTREFARELTEQWNLKLIEARPTKVLKQIYADKGVDTLFKRKGQRGGKKPVVEQCCGALKHTPMKKAIRENGWHLMFNGVRCGESRQRWMSGRRDGDFYYSTSEWKMFTCRPILWWTALSDSFNYGNNQQEDVWGYVRLFNLPYNKIYDMNAVLDDRYSGDQTIVDRETAERLSAQGYNVFMPRTGCQACPIPIKRGGLRYLRQVFPKVYRGMIFQLGFGRVLLAEMPDDEKAKLMDELLEFGVLDEATEERIIERLETILELKPCIFDEVGVDKRKK